MHIVVAAYSYPMEQMGGAEYQTLILARGLVERGHQVVFLGTATEQEGSFEAEGISVRKLPARSKIGAARYRRLAERAIQEAAPDLCYVRSFWDLSMLSSICRRARVPVVSMSCHSMETTPLPLELHPLRAARYLFSSHSIVHMRSFFAIANSAVHVCNTKTLQQQVQRWFPRMPIQAIYNGTPVPPPECMHHGTSGQIIWVNNLKRWKRPEVLIDLARRLPQYRFVMIGRMAEGRFGKEIHAMLREAPANLDYLGPLPVDRVNELISQSDLLLYTSIPVEGFGNSFAQAWFRGVPTVSLSYELDGILEQEQVGRCSHTVEQLARDVDTLMQDEPLRQAMGQRARNYATTHLAADIMVANYAHLFHEVVTNQLSVESI